MSFNLFDAGSSQLGGSVLGSAAGGVEDVGLERILGLSTERTRGCSEGAMDLEDCVIAGGETTRTA